MEPIDEKGSLWEFDTGSSEWSLVTPTEVQPGKYPQARSYHCMTSDGRNTIFVHAGCPETGRLSDLWEFNLTSRRWKKLMSAPDPPRGGASIAFLGGVLYRINGFDGNTEQGGSLDMFHPDTNTWSSIAYTPDGESGPVPRSVSALLPVIIGGKAHLVTLFGERDPSSLGHQGAGKMLGDVWAFDIESKTWNHVDVQGGMHLAARGWFAADAFAEDKILVQGGLGESNERLGDVWLLSF